MGTPMPFAPSTANEGIELQFQEVRGQTRDLTVGLTGRGRHGAVDARCESGQMASGAYQLVLRGDGVAGS